ncbi:hypothetical protein [uncultured Bifidobacterium sp.]|uniref:hypothetical protein n=1 Tax=uncultured Bifidobacterium sp. TaxID=165187 RepID=UPI00258F2F17|nr:hypothetical protein [uncultured Bifidobacterium sp.]
MHSTDTDPDNAPKPANDSTAANRQNAATATLERSKPHTRHRIFRCLRPDWLPFAILWVVASVVIVLLTISTHPADSTYPMHYAGGTFLVDQAQYQRLADAFLHGHTWIDTHVPDWLATMSNPYDAQARGAQGAASGDPSLWDWAFYHGRYYCYFGPLPAIVLFAPYKALTGTDLPTAAACAILAIAACASLTFLVQTLWKRFWKGTPRWFAVLTCTAIIAASGLSYLVLVPWFYSIPMLASLALAPAGIAFWARSADDVGSAPRTGMVAAGSTLVALTITCRPTFILTAVFGLILLWPHIRSREMLSVRSRHAIQASLAAIVPFLLAGGAMMWYNAARFDNPFDFGATYNLTGFDMTQRYVSPQARLFGAALLLFAPIRFMREFPFTADVFAADATNPWAFLIRNRNVIAEPTVGGIVALSPICLLALPAVIWFIVSRVSRKRTEAAGMTGTPTVTSSGMQSEKSSKGTRQGMPKSSQGTWQRTSRSCAIGITCLLLVGVIACIDSPAGVNARYMCDMAWLAVIGTMCLLMPMEAASRKKGHRWLTITIVAFLVFGLVLQALWLMTTGRFEAWNVSNPALYAWLQGVFTR